MRNNRRDEKTSIRMRKDILEVAEKLQQDYGYSKADIFEIGVLLLDNNENNDLIIKNEIYCNLIKRFSKMEKKVHQHCTLISEEIKKNILQLESEKKNTELLIEKKGNMEESYSMNQLNECMNVICGIIEMRENEKKYGSRATIFEPLGSSFYELQSKKFNVPLDVILSELESRGYSDEVLIDLGMNPHVKWEGYATAKKESLM